MRSYFKSAPPPYQSRHNLAPELRTIPFALLGTRNWPQFPEGFVDAVGNMQTARVSPQTFFLPIAAANHPYTGAYGAVDAVRNAQAQLSAFRHVMSKYLGGQSLTPAEARVVLAARMPCPSDELAWNASKRAACPGAPQARQVSFQPRFAPPVAVLRIMSAVQTGNMFNPTQMLSNAGSRMRARANALRTAELNRSSGPSGPAVMRQGPASAIQYAVPVDMVEAYMSAPQGAPPRTATRLNASMPPYVPPVYATPASTKSAVMSAPASPSPTQRRMALKAAAAQMATRQQTLTHR